MGEFVRPNALVLRNELKNRLESFSVLGKDLQGHQRLRALTDLALGDAVDDYEVWLGRVRVGLHGALDFGLAEAKRVRVELVEGIRSIWHKQCAVHDPHDSESAGPDCSLSKRRLFSNPPRERSMQLAFDRADAYNSWVQNPQMLTSEQVSQYKELGFCSPVRVLSADESSEARGRLETHEATLGHPISAGQRIKSHYLFRWVDNIMRSDRILDAVEDLIGPNLLCWGSIFWIKEAESKSFVGWHQDLQYWGLETTDLVNVWVALSPASPSSGCMSVLPGSHLERLEHVETYDEDSLLTRGQELTLDITTRSPVTMALEPGEMSIHNGRSAHGSGPNTTDDRRIGLSFQYVPTSAKQTLVDWDTAALVRGVDEYNHFEHGSSPISDLHPEAVAFHERAVAAQRELLYLGAQQDTTPTL